MDSISIQRSNRNILDRFNGLPWWVQWIIVAVLATTLFSPLLSNTFVNDDHIVLKKVYLEGELNVHGFFRPLSDILLMINGWLGGLNPVGYYLLQVLMHATNTLLLFRFCRKWNWSDDPRQQQLFALIAAIFFLTYAFHTECMTWLLGRASLSANTFSIVALNFMVGSGKARWRIAGFCISWFIAMAGYETVMVLPAIVFIWLLHTRAGVRQIGGWIVAMVITLVIHFILRKAVSEVIVNNYGEGFFQMNLPAILGNIVKVSGRIFLPPLNNDKLLLVLILLLAAILVVTGWVLWRRLHNQRSSIRYFLSLIAMLMIALLPPFLLGVSTHTSESDRFLYFPSFFLCMLMSFVLVVIFNRQRILWLFVSLITSYHIFFLLSTIGHWRKASATVQEILNITSAHKGPGILYIVNMPDEIEGAFVFRSGFPEALELYNIDPSFVRVVNHVSRDQLISIPGKELTSTQTAQGLSIPPAITVIPGTPGNSKGQIVGINKGDRVVFWNKVRWVQL